MPREGSEEPGDLNAYLECFLLHYRNLVESLSTKKPRYLTDLRVGKPRAWARPGMDKSKFPSLAQERLHKKYWEDLSRYLGHCTTHRAESPMTWRPTVMYEEINPTLNRFAQAAGLPRLVPDGIKQAGPGSSLGAATATASGLALSGTTDREKDL